MFSRLAVVIAMTLILGGCATPVKNAREARLMPEEVAKSILIKSLGASWANNPTGVTVGALGCSGRYPMPFSEVNRVVVSLTGNQVTVSKYNVFAWPCGNSVHAFFPRQNPPSDEEINDIVDALVSLGAKIPENRAERK